ncbi:MAG: hypothetical protein ACYTG0_08445 [Planctomycetota bacterium]|jgi:hypothetical protein
MARESQWLQIWLIVFVMLTIILGVTTFLFWKQYEKKAEEAASAVAAKETADQSETKAQGEMNRIKQDFLGQPPTATIDTCQEEFNKDKETFGVAYPGQNWNYHTGLSHLYDVIENKNQSLAAALESKAAVEAQVAAMKKSFDTDLAKQTQRADASGDNLVKEQAAYQDSLQKNRVVTNQVQDVLATSEEARKKIEEDLKKQLQDLQSEMNDVSDVNKQLIQDIEKGRRPVFELSDGKVVRVDQRHGIVWLNLGRADALSRQTTFSVYPAETNDVTKAVGKAKIEVTQVLGDHLAEARITEDDIANPIMPGDLIHTMVWAPGEKEHFALLTGMDIDGDGRSDLDLIRNIISMNGGVVDCYINELDENFPREGAMTVKTRYLVEGDEPDVDSTEEIRAKTMLKIQAHSDMITDAENLGLRKIQLRELLARMGWKRQTSVIQLGVGAPVEQFKPLPPEGGPRESSGAVSPLFQPRRPPGAGRDTTY